jgi:hypothetical protein
MGYRLVAAYHGLNVGQQVYARLPAAGLIGTRPLGRRLRVSRDDARRLRMVGMGPSTAPTVAGRIRGKAARDDR